MKQYRRNRMAKRKMVQHNLVKNAIAAYFAAVEIHNKPNIPYRYETVTLLIMNAWELALKAYVKKFIKRYSIFTDTGHTISCGLALKYVSESINSKKPKSFEAIKRNIEAIEEYRNSVAHFYNSQLIPCIFSLVARSALNFVEFIKEYFGKDIMVDDGLFILPLGFKLPFKPEDFLSRSTPAYTSSPEAQKFIDSIINISCDLAAQGIEDSIVLGFDVFMQSAKKIQNSDIIVAVSSEAATTISTVKKIQLSSDSNAVPVYLSDDEFFKIYIYSHTQLVEACKKEIPNFRQDKRFINAKRALAEMENSEAYYKERRLDPRNKKSSLQKFYTPLALQYITRYFMDVSNKKTD